MVTDELHLPSELFAGAVERFARDPEQTLIYPLGLSQIDGVRQWLVRSSPRDVAATGPSLRLVAGLTPEQLRERVAQVRGGDASRRPGIVLGLGIQQAAGHLTAVGVFAHGLVPLERVVIVGPGLHQIPIYGGTGEVDAARAHGRGERFRSRTVGALGTNTVERLQRLTITVIGCGRLGSLVVAGLVPLGIHRLLLVDPDLLEDHNLGEMVGVSPSDVGRPKACVLAEHCQRTALDGKPTATPIVSSVHALEGLYAVKRSDVLISCPDNAPARLASAALAAIYLKPLLDIGTGIVAHRGGQQMGADVRLVLPGRCLHCFGGIAGIESAAVDLLRGAPTELAQRLAPERLGSLRSLNTIAVGLAQTLLEQLAVGRLRASTWLQLDIDELGRPHLNIQTPRTNNDCPICALAALGDAGLDAFPEVLRRLAG
jgi:hypothetical protein